MYYFGKCDWHYFIVAVVTIVYYRVHIEDELKPMDSDHFSYEVKISRNVDCPFKNDFRWLL